MCSVEDNPPGLLDPNVLQQGLEGSSLRIKDVRAPTNLNWLHGESRHNEDSSGFSFHDRVLSLLNCSRNEDGCSSPLVGLDVGERPVKGDDESVGIEFDGGGEAAPLV